MSVDLSTKTLQDFYDGYNELWETGYLDESPSSWSAGTFFFLGRLADLVERIQNFERQIGAPLPKDHGGLDVVIGLVTDPGVQRDELTLAVIGMFEDLEEGLEDESEGPVHASLYLIFPGVTNAVCGVPLEGNAWNTEIDLVTCPRCRELLRAYVPKD